MGSTCEEKESAVREGQEWSCRATIDFVGTGLVRASILDSHDPPWASVEPSVLVTDAFEEGQ
jgi:hypothetical protein